MYIHMHTHSFVVSAFFQELKRGRDKLKREVRKNEVSPVVFMQDNLDAFLLCYQTLSDIPHWHIYTFIPVHCHSIHYVLHHHVSAGVWVVADG